MISIRSGDRIGNYLLQQRCGQGSFAEVWKARHHVLDEEVAVKIPTDPQYVRNLQREGVAIHGLRHPNIVRALDLDPYATPPYLIMEFVDGPTLRTVIDGHDQGLPIRTVVAILRGVLEALHGAHAQAIIHRDLKPANILLAIGDAAIETVTSGCVKIADFGLGQVGTLTTASIMQSGSLLDRDGGLSGTIAYMAPEQRDGETVDGRCDLYACGMLLFEMLTGRRPQGSDLPSDLRPDAPAELDAVFQRCNTRVERRYASATDMLADIDRAFGTQTSAPPPSGLAAGDRRSCPGCQATAEPEDQFCIHCGRQLAAELLRCPQCRAIARPEDNFCILCGTPLRGAAAPAENPGT